MRTKQDIWDELLNNPAYKAAVEKVDPKEKVAIESFLGGKFLDALFELEKYVQRVNTDPQLLSEFEQALSGNSSVFNAKSSVSGSAG